MIQIHIHPKLISGFTDSNDLNTYSEVANHSRTRCYDSLQAGYHTLSHSRLKVPWFLLRVMITLQLN